MRGRRAVRFGMPPAAASSALAARSDRATLAASSGRAVRAARTAITALAALTTVGVFAFCAAPASANGSGGGGRTSAPAPAPSGGSAHGGGGTSRGGSGGGSARGSGGGPSRGSGGSARGGTSRGTGGGTSRASYGAGNTRGGNGGGIPRGTYGGGTRGGGGTAHAQSASVRGVIPPVPVNAKAAKVDPARVTTNRWVCRGPGGALYYSWAGPCEDVLDDAAEPQPAMVESGRPAGFINGTDYATDPFTVGIAPGAGTPRSSELAIPIQTRKDDTMAPYAVILRDGMAFASVEAPKQVGGMIVGRDRTGNLFSIKSTEVDMGATRPLTSDAAGH